MDEQIAKGYPVSSTASIVYEPVIAGGGHIVTIKYKYNVNISVANIVPYTTAVTHKIYSHKLNTDDDVHKFIGAQVIDIHSKYPMCKILSIEITSKLNDS